MREPRDADRNSRDVLPGEPEQSGKTRSEVIDDADLLVSTGIAATVDDTSAVLEGSLDVLPGAGVAVGFEYRATGADEWTTADVHTRSTPGTFDRRVEGLAPGTDYEFRAFARAGEYSATGSVASFATTSAGTPPDVDHYEASEAGLPNPHAEVTVEWTVSDDGGDLSTVLVRVVDASGQVVDATTSDVTGEVASGTDHFRIRDGSGRRFDVKLTVADVDGNTSTATAAVAGRSP